MPQITDNYDKLYNYIKKEYYETSLYGLNTYNSCYLSNQFRKYIELWEAWYSGFYEDFHIYEYYNGIDSVDAEKKSLKMAKKVCEDKASLLLNEKVDINIDTDTDKEFVDTVLLDNKFWVNANQLVEKTNALGTGAIIEFLEHDKINIDYVSARSIIPITVINGEIINCAFVSQTKIADDNVFYLNTHIKLEPSPKNADKETVEKRIERGIPKNYEGYIIENRILKIDKTGESLMEINAEQYDMVDYVLTNTNIPYFQIIKPNIVNNLCLLDSSNGMGISVFANAIDVLQSLDNAYDNMDNEIVAGRKRIMVHDKFSKIEIQQNNGNSIMKPVFDKKDTVFFAMDMGEAGVPVKEIDMKLRVNECASALDKQLNILSMRCGLGNNYYKFEGGQVKTATEVISDNSPLFRTLKKDELLLEAAIIGMVRAILHLGGKTTEQGIDINFDDSIFEDIDTIRQQALLEYNAGVIDKAEYFVRVYKYTEEQAIKKVQEMENRMSIEIEKETERLE